MVAGRERNFERAQPYALPFIQFVHNVESEVMDQISDASRNDNRLIGRDTPQGPPVEMIEVGVRDQDISIDGRLSI